MVVEIKTKLRQYREELADPKVSQETIAHQANLSLHWYRQLETGQALRTSFTSAKALLHALNTEREARHLDRLNLEQLELCIV